MRSAEITLSFTNGWDKVTAARLYIVQANARDDFGTERSFEEIRALCGPGQVVTIENDYYISAWVVSDAAGGNMGANPMTTESTINYEVCKKTAYVESIDGSLGFMIETETADDNIFMRYSRIQLALKGVRLVHDTDPDRFSLKGVKSAMIISSQLGTAADIPRKEKRIGQLTDDDHLHLCHAHRLRTADPQRPADPDQRGVCQRHGRQPYGEMRVARARHRG